MNELLLQTEKVDHAVVVHINPWRLQPRKVAQQGIFLCKLVDQSGFSAILMSMIIHSKQLVLPPVRRIRVSKTLRIPFLKKLREMNIDRASLFPGLDGFGQSLKVDLEIKAAEVP